MQEKTLLHPFAFLLIGLVMASVADPGCLSQIPDPGSEFFHPESRSQGKKKGTGSWIPDAQQRI
jgi:hypothetical protein